MRTCSLSAGAAERLLQLIYLASHCDYYSQDGSVCVRVCTMSVCVVCVLSECVCAVCTVVCVLFVVSECVCECVCGCECVCVYSEGMCGVCT